MCVRDATEDKLCCAGPVGSNDIDQSELYRIEWNDDNKIKSMQIHESKRKYSQSESKCNLLLEIHICMYVCLYLCLCVCNANNYEFLRLYGCVVIGQTVCLAVPSVRMCVCVRVCQWVLLCECVCECVCATASLRLSRQGQREIRRCCRWQTSSGSSAISCVCKLRMCWCVRVTGANPASTIIISINKRTFSFFVSMCTSFATKQCRCRR